MSSNYTEFNPYTILADVIDFGILSADDFLVIERPNRQNRLASYRQPPRQPSYRLPVLLPIPVPHPIYFPVFYYSPQRYLLVPPPLQLQFTINLPAPVASTIQIREIDNLPPDKEPARQKIESKIGVNVTLSPQTERSSATDSGVSTDDEDIKTPYQGNRRSFGLFSCGKCSRYWRSANTWANMWQTCFACLEHVYPRCQIAQNVCDLYHTRTINDSVELNARNKQHPQEYCEMCQALNQNCRFLDYAPTIKEENRKL